MRKSSGNGSESIAARPPQRQRGRARVAALLAAAGEVFREKGHDAATMTEIAARAGASIGSLYMFFPTKAALVHEMLTALSDELSARIEALGATLGGRRPGDIADALFAELSAFLEAHPVYLSLVDLPGEEQWRCAVRTRRRAEIAGLFAKAEPALPNETAERLAMIVPQLMRVPVALVSESIELRQAILDDLRRMLRRHLDAETSGLDAAS